MERRKTTRKEPVQCLYWTDASAIREGMLKDRFELIETYVKDDQFWQYLLRCRECGQLYFMEFREETDWVGGNDPQYTTYVPVRDVEEGAKVQKVGCVHFAPRLQSMYPEALTHPILHWITA